MIHINENQDEWNLLNYDDNISKTNDLNDKSIGGQLQILCCENYETAKNYDIRPEFLEEMKLWDQFFPNLTVEGKKIQINHISNTKTNHSLATRMMIARRLVMNFIFPDLQHILQTNLLYSKTLPRLQKKTIRSKSTITCGKHDQKSTTLPAI